MSALVSDKPTLFWRFLHICGLWQLAVAWPIYQLLLSAPEFFVARKAGAIDVLFLLLTCSFVLPLALCFLMALVTYFFPRFGRSIQVMALAILFALIPLTAMGGEASSTAVAGLAALLLLLVTWLYPRRHAFRTFVSVLAVMAFVVPIIFLTDEDIIKRFQTIPAELQFIDDGKAADIPILMVVFDELPVTALLTNDGELNHERFPGFSRLASQSTWYPTATTVATRTSLALPALLTGRFPKAFLEPHVGEYRENLFTWLSESHTLNIREVSTQLCPLKDCPKDATLSTSDRLLSLLLDASAIYLNLSLRDLYPWKLPPINQTWGQFWGNPETRPGLYHDRADQLNQFIESLGTSSRPRIDFLHIIFPHIPYEYFPSGNRYLDGWLMPGFDLATNSWTGSEEDSQRVYKRFILQLGHADRFISKLIERTQELGLWESTLVIITADHGASFIPNTNRRDSPGFQSLDQQILAVPLFIKYPNQSEGRVDAVNAELIDVVPTIFHVADREPAWNVDGHSLLLPKADRSKTAVHLSRQMAIRNTTSENVLGPDRFDFRRGWPGFSNTNPNLNAIGAHSDLIGQSISAAEMTQDARFHFALDRPMPVNLQLDQTSVIPAHISGEVHWSEGDFVDVIVSVNQQVAATTRVSLEEGMGRFAVLLPEEALQNGENQVELFILHTASPFHLITGRRQDDAQDQWTLRENNLWKGNTRLVQTNGGIEAGWHQTRHGPSTIEITGWAIDADRVEQVDRILVFSGSELVYSGRTNGVSEETHKFGVILNLGFHAVIARQNLSRSLPFRLFAVNRNGEYLELEPPIKSPN